MAKRRHRCDVPGCGRERYRWQRLCDTCFRQLPPALSERIKTAFRFRSYADHRAACRKAREFLDAREGQQAAHDDFHAPHMMRD